MPQPYDRVFNFSAGPSTLPVPVLEKAQAEMMNFRGTGMSLMEMSHRSAPFEEVLHNAEADFRALLGIPDRYKVLFLQGGASTQFATIPMSYLPAGKKARYVITGSWGKKALESAKILGDAEVVWDGKSGNYNDVPNDLALDASDDVAYTHFTSNETIQGVRFSTDPNWGGPLVCDMSSDILSRPVDISKYDLIYAGAQKNMGPAGVAIVVISDEMLAKGPDGLPPMFDYRVHAENDSMYNTPATWGIYICGLVYRHLLDTGGLEAAAERNDRKAKLLYDAIDGSNGFFKGHAVPSARSTMNVTFTLASDDLTKAFLKEAQAKQLDGLKGHRSVGGCRASIYNAFPEEGCQVLADLMRDFASRNG
ncbi:phosphoserine transaminase [Fimbriimonas ginsengisoli]|uniref:Phosphoserine aminotransferase n=1 Tax=Fimbriimonas ginsengisoli Gsoil 348 TaxID=661478 RepID=A0A068NXE8_FIMGI|nr:phosphoserine transaminase [Fimbriimonas ginsengisoli]AIE86309.1 phosphoserine aminotransferase [Fimbriimonas ginsengisoli Gsoil 348]